MSALLTVIGQRVRERRKSRDLSLLELAKRSGLSQRFLGDVEAGKANISVLNLAELAKALDLDLPALVAHEKERRVISLLGLRGAGKSSVGAALAKKLSVPFVELDQLIEAEAGMRLSELFAIHGEAYYRDVERRVLDRFIEQNDAGVLATGGGLVTNVEAFDLLRAKTITIWLRASPEDHWGRVVRQGDMRPMQNRPHAMTELKRRLKEREPLYRRARHTCMTSKKSVDAVVGELSALYSPPSAQ